MTQSDEPRVGRFEVWVEKGAPRGDLYELEQKTIYRVVDLASNEVLMAFEGLMEASLSRETGLWDDYTFSGVREVFLAPDERSVTVQYCDGREEIVPLPILPAPLPFDSEEPPAHDEPDPQPIDP
jgi:hypothetical protein